MQPAQHIAVVVGTRPEIIKLASIIRECEARPEVELTIIHTGQHYSESLNVVFFDQLECPTPDYNLDVGSHPHGQQTAKMIAGIEEILRSENPDIVLVQGDTNSVLAGAIAADKLDSELGHVEAGLRSFDREMPEESNRRVTDHLADYLFAPTPESAQQLRDEDISDDRIYVTGNTVVDAVQQNLELARAKSNILEQYDTANERFALMTSHRAENVDDSKRFQGILDGVQSAASAMDVEVFYPVHPRAQDKLTESDMEVPERVTTIDPLNYLDFLLMESEADIVFTDSGGVQEEACILGVPCVTIRDETERPETVRVGANVVTGTDPADIVDGANEMRDTDGNWKNPFGDGTSGESIVDIVQGVDRGVEVMQ